MFALLVPRNIVLQGSNLSASSLYFVAQLWCSPVGLATRCVDFFFILVYYFCANAELRALPLLSISLVCP